MVIESVLMVCVGNICRSPMAEYILRAQCEQRNEDVHIASAGIAALVGHGADAKVKQLMALEDIDIAQHQAQQLTAELLVNFELLLVMEKGHIKVINSMAPQSRGRVHLLGKWNGDEEIADPYKQSEAHFKAARSAIGRGITAWGKYL